VELPELLNSTVSEIQRIRGQQPHGQYDVIHSHCWISGVAGLELSRRWRGRWCTPCTPWPKVKNLVLRTFHLLFAGGVQRLKRPQVLVQTAALLRRRSPDIDLKLTGLGAPSGTSDFNLKSLTSAAGMDDVVTHLPPAAAPELAG